jgi:hypothetical protein
MVQPLMSATKLFVGSAVLLVVVSTGRFHVIVSGSDGAFDAKGPIFKHPLGSRRRFIRKVTNGTLKNFRPLPDSL